MSEPDFLYKPGENTAFRASLVEHWPSHYKKEMTGKLYLQAEPVMVNGLIEAETATTASVAGLSPAAAIAWEIECLRAEQSAAVMPQIGPLLDAWDGMDNDLKETLREEAAGLVGAIGAIARGMDGDADRAAIRDGWRRAWKVAPAPAAHAGEAASILTYLWRTGFFSGHPEERLPLEMRDRIAAIACAHDGIEQGASSAPRASPAEAPAAPWTPEAIAVLGAAKPVAPAGQAETPKCRFSTGAVNPWSVEKTAGELAGQAAAGVQGEVALWQKREMNRLLPSGEVGWTDWSEVPDYFLEQTLQCAKESPDWIQVRALYTHPAPAVERGVADVAFKACMDIADDLRNHDVVRMTAAKCALAVRSALSTAGKEQA